MKILGIDPGSFGRVGDHLALCGDVPIAKW